MAKSGIGRGGPTRRHIVRGLGVGLACGLLPARALAEACAVTPRQATGPFYPTVALDEDWDLTRVAGGTGRAEGSVVEIAGQVLDGQCRPVPGAMVELWQANAVGRYDHPRDPSTAPLDPNFQGHARLVADAEGRYRLVTIKPGAYPVPGGPVENWSRPPHIHFRVYVPGGPSVTTQMYFAGEPLNDHDLLLQSVPEGARDSLVVAFDEQAADGTPRGQFDIALTATG